MRRLVAALVLTLIPGYALGQADCVDGMVVIRLVSSQTPPTELLTASPPLFGVTSVDQVLTQYAPTVIRPFLSSASGLAHVSAKDLDRFVDPAPVFEVYALKQTLSGDPEPSKFESTKLPMSRPVATGTDRLVKIDITEFVQKILADPSKNHGLVVGPLTNDKRGVFVVKEDGFGAGIPARIRILE